MSIECYYSACKYHGCHTAPDDGPFCAERECKATPEQLIVFQKQREEFLKGIYGETIPTHPI